MLADWNQQYKDGSTARYWPNEELARFLGRTYGPPINNRNGLDQGVALDLGCGVGGNMLPMIWCGFKVTGMDMSDEALKAARYWLDSNDFLYSSQYHLLQHTLPERLKSQDERIDLVIDIQCIQHLSEADHLATYKEIYRVLKPGGRFFSVHWDTGDQAKIFPQHPELLQTSASDARINLVLAGLRLEGSYLISRGYSLLGTSAHWSVIEAVKS